MEKLKNTSLSVFIVLLACAVLFHIAMTILYIIPFNPVTAKLQTLNSSYIHPLFTQNWKLFAPDPISVNYSVYMQVKSKDGSETDWMNISSSWIEESHKRIVTPYNRMARIPMGAVHQSMYQDEILTKLEEKRSQQNPEYIEEEPQEDYSYLVQHREQGLNTLYRFAFALAPKVAAAEDIDEVRLRVVIAKGVPFSERKVEDYTVEELYIDYPWRPYYYVISPY